MARFYNPPELNMCTASKHPYPPYRCAVCGRYRYYYDSHCMMAIGFWRFERNLGRICGTCQDQLWEAKAFTCGAYTGDVFVRPDYRLRLRALHQQGGVSEHSV